MDGLEYKDYKIPRRSRQFGQGAVESSNSVIFNPNKYPSVMHVSDLLKKFQASDQLNDQESNQGSQSMPSSSRPSFTLSPRVSNLSRPSGSGLIHKGSRERYSLVVSLEMCNSVGHWLLLLSLNIALYMDVFRCRHNIATSCLVHNG